ncbi:MtrAB system histidine kinase MtrB [Janibacter sp. GXQ6167]|uniref:MtrAB system histidine kinase MtrB n=1 Tax=Janibacter sp. GXQ6167 TaxID=3240791 RepID=UPI003526707B
MTDGPSPAGSAAARAVRTVRNAFVGVIQRCYRAWRGSLQVRVIISTLLLGVVTVSLVSAYMYSSIADGLVEDAVTSAQAESRHLTSQAQGYFDQTDRTYSVDQLSASVSNTVDQHLASPGKDNSRYVILIRSLNNTEPTELDTVYPRRAGIGPDQVPTELRQAVAADPGRQQTTVIDLERTTPANPADPSDPATTTQTVPAVVVGSQVQIPGAGPYDLYFIFPLDQEERTLDVVGRSFLLGAVLLILLVSAVAYVVTRQAVTPVRRAASVAERLAAGHLNDRMAARGRDELAMLGQSFNEMADNLQAQIRQLEGLSRVQQRFVSDVSHELRTPLTTIRMAAEVINASTDEMNPVTARSAELLTTELDRFEALLADLLEISRFDAGAAVLEGEPSDLVGIVARAVVSAEPIAKRRGSEVRVHSSGPAIADVDARRIERVLRNLVVNAVEHGEGRPVDIYIARNDSAVSVLVADRGVGLRAGEASMVFNRFWRADPARARTTGGTGLGLAISLEDARLHHGWLQAWGEPGEGSRFRLTVPIEAGGQIESAPLPLTPREGELAEIDL